MELNLKSSKPIKVIFEDKEYLLKKPAMAQALELEKALEATKSGAKSSNEVVISFIESCGMPREIILQLEVDAIDELVKVLMPAKKN